MIINQGNVLGKIAAEAGLLLPPQSLPDLAGGTSDVVLLPTDQQSAAHYAQMAKVLLRFTTAHEGEGDTNTHATHR